MKSKRKLGGVPENECSLQKKLNCGYASKINFCHNLCCGIINGARTKHLLTNKLYAKCTQMLANVIHHLKMLIILICRTVRWTMKY